MKAFAAASLLLLLAGQLAGQEITSPPAEMDHPLVLTPAPADLVFDLWRPEAMVHSGRIKKVVFLVDGKIQKTVDRPPFRAKLDIQHFPVEQTVRAEGYDAAGVLVASDEVILNQPRGALGLWILDPPRGAKIDHGRITARAALNVPDGRRVEALEWKLNDAPVAKLSRPPWQTEIDVPAGDVAYLSAVVTLDDGSHTEAVRFLKSPQVLDEIDVGLVELFVAVTDAAKHPIADLESSDFEVYEAGRKQQVVKVEPARNLPWTVGILLDTSRSMDWVHGAARQAATDFLHSALRPNDKAFSVTFADRPHLETPPTSDLQKVEFGAPPNWDWSTKNPATGASWGYTALHDAVIQSLYYVRGQQGQRALVMVTDGGDNASFFTTRDTVEYARRSGVVLYTIGFHLPMLGSYDRAKLAELCEVTGGRLFSIENAGELAGAYTQIENELRSRYRVTYDDDGKAAGGPPGYREITVKIKKNGLKARTVSGTYRSRSLS